MIATRADKTPLAISLAFTDSDCERICNSTLSLYYHTIEFTCAHDAINTDKTPPEAAANIILTAIKEGIAWNGTGIYGAAMEITKLFYTIILYNYT